MATNDNQRVTVVDPLHVNIKVTCPACKNTYFFPMLGEINSLFYGAISLCKLCGESKLERDENGILSLVELTEIDRDKIQREKDILKKYEEEQLPPANIPPIKERQYRKCETCVFDIGDGDCTAMALGFHTVDERTDIYYSTNLTWNQKQNCPCRFHLTRSELAQILDPYFME